MKRTIKTVLLGIGLAGLLSLSAAAAGDAGGEVDLSPASWPPGELEKYTELNVNYDRPHPRGVGRHGLVVGTGGALALRAGLEALKQGGTAADAAIVIALAQTSLAAGAWVSFAGEFLMTYYEAANDRVYFLDAGFNTVQREKDPLSIPPQGVASGRSALVPGFMAGVEASHRRFGKLPWASLFEPAIYFAEEGFPIEPDLGRAIEMRADVLNRSPATRAIFTSPDGDLYRTGEHLRQPQLAATLRRMAQRGAEYMYRGVWARRFVKAVRAEGGNIAMSDMRDYEVMWLPPVGTGYRDYRVFGPNKPSYGGIFIVEALERIEPDNLIALGHYTESAEAFYRLLEATRVHYLEPVELAGGSHSEGVITIDEAGNVAAVLHSINTLFWGTTGIFVDGVSISDNGASYQGLIDDVGPGVRLPGTANTMIVLRGGRPVMATSCIGSDLFGATIQGLVNVLEYGFDPKRAQHVPYFRPPDMNDPLRPTLVTPGDFSPSLLDEVRAMGVPIVEQEPGEGTRYSYWIGAIIEPNGRRMGATTNAFNGHAEGY